MCEYHMDVTFTFGFICVGGVYNWINVVDVVTICQVKFGLIFEPLSIHGCAPLRMMMG